MKRDFRRWLREDARRQDFPVWQVWAARGIGAIIVVWLIVELTKRLYEVDIK